MKKRLLLFVSVWIIGTMGFGQELIQNGDFELPDDGRKYNLVDSIPNWFTDDTAANNGRDFLEENAIGWHWDGGKSIYQVVGTVPATEAQFAISFDATCMYSWWGDYVTDVYVIFSAFPGTDTLSRVPIDSITFSVSCLQANWFQWETLTGEFALPEGSEHAGENLVVEIEIYDSRLFGYDESWTYLYYDNVSVIKSVPSSVNDLTDKDINVVSTPEWIRITGKYNLESAMIFDLTGKRVMETRPNSTQTTLQVGHLDHGIYLVKVKSNGKFLTRKVVL